jgi:hypothetical protein
VDDDHCIPESIVDAAMRNEMVDELEERNTTAQNSDIKGYLEQLLTKSGTVFDLSMTTLNSSKIAASHIFCGEMADWCKVLDQRGEAELLRVATVEYQFALLALAQGHYRHAFKGLRLVLELILQAVSLSTNELLLREWLDNRADTIWSAITDKQEGVFSDRFAKAFFPELIKHVQNYREMATKVYRECSECVHGNTPKCIPLPSCLEFDQEVFDLWHSKASVVALIAHFVLSLRYLLDLAETDVSDLEHFLSDRLGHVEEIRSILGGPAKG